MAKQVKKSGPPVNLTDEEKTVRPRAPPPRAATGARWALGVTSSARCRLSLPVPVYFP